MKNRFCWIILLFVIVAAVSLVSCTYSEAAPVDQNRLNNLNAKYSDKATNFDGTLEVKVNGRMEKIILLPAGWLKVPAGLEKKGTTTWKDIADYEMTTYMGRQDPYANWFMENLWIDRTNAVLAALEDKLKKEYPNKYTSMSIPVLEVTKALGIDPAVGPLTGEELVKIPVKFGGRVPHPDIGKFTDALDTEAYIGNVTAADQPPETKDKPY